MKYSSVSYNPIADRNLAIYIQDAIKKAIKDIQTCIPAIVQEVKGRNKVIVSPAVQKTSPSWETLTWADIVLPVYTPTGNAGNAVMSFPVKAGDIGWIIAGDLDPSLYFQDTSRPARQNVFDRHKYQYGFFMPAKINDLGIDDADDGGIVIKNGSTKIVIKENEIEIKSNNTLKINANSANISSSGNITIQSTGSGGNIDIKTDGNDKVKIDGLNFKSHCHISGAEGSPTGGAQSPTP